MRALVSPLTLPLAAALLFAAPSADAAEDGGEPCLPEKERPAVVLPWADADELCAADFGEPAPTDLLPPADLDNLEVQNGYAEKVEGFLRGFAYRDLGWNHDARWRSTGDWAGCPENGEVSWTNGVHPLVRIHYSPEIMEWLCRFRRDGTVTSGEEEDLPPGAMIVKEMHSGEVADGQQPVLAYRPGTGTEESLGKLWVDADFDRDGVSWTIMVKGAATADGWYWGDFSQASSPDAATYNPPLNNPTAFAAEVDPATGFPIVVDEDGKPYPPPPADHWYPTYWQYSVPDVVFPNYGAGYYCIYCHGSAVSQSTFSSLANVLGDEIEYDYRKEIPPLPGPTPIQEHGRKASLMLKLRPAAAHGGRDPFPDYRPLNAEAFERTYPQFEGLSYAQVWRHRLPAQTWDHAAAAADGGDEFLTSDQCLACHGAGGYGQRLPNMVVVKDTRISGGEHEQVNLTPYAEWSASPMGLGGRDPIFYAMLESELNRAEREGGELEKNLACIQNTCLHCHGNMGQRQWALDTEGSGDDPCAGFEPATDPTVPAGGAWTAEERRRAGYGGRPFLRDMMKAWPGDDSGHGKYGGLGRDGISCATCHRMSAEDLGPSGKTFTGNFRVGPSDELYGPFEDNIATGPMELSLGIEPVFGEHLSDSAMCGSCHSIYLPVFDNQGTLARRSFEQTTYLEWLNSAFNSENKSFPPRVWQSCQDCHMRDRLIYHDDHGELVTVDLDQERIANVQDETFPAAEFAQDLDLEYRDYKRHTLYGLNVFLNAYFQQFPLILGVRQQDYMDPTPTAPLLAAREEVLMIARLATARVAVGSVEVDPAAGTLSAEITVTNLAGHKFPSGVGFRRAFIELLALDVDGEPIWASGRTSAVGILQQGLEDRDLPSELLRPAPGTACPDAHQPHYEVISEPCQVQIYEELTKDSAGAFTTSFLHRFEHVKDNRLLPKGYRPLAAGDPRQPEYCAPWCAEANPDGSAKDDPDYQGTGPLGVSGQDTVTYRIALSADDLARVKTVRATLYSQSTAPYFLNQRFDDAKAGPRSVDSERLYFLNKSLNTQARAADGSAYIDQYKLEIYRASATVGGD